MPELGFCIPALWKESLLSRDTWQRGVALPQFDMPEYVDSPWEVFLSLSCWGGVLGEARGAEGERTVVGI